MIPPFIPPLIRGDAEGRVDNKSTCDEKLQQLKRGD